MPDFKIVVHFMLNLRKLASTNIFKQIKCQNAKISNYKPKPNSLNQFYTEYSNNMIVLQVSILDPLLFGLYTNFRIVIYVDDIYLLFLDGP